MNATTLTDVQIQERSRDKRRAELSEMALSTDAGALMVPVNGRDLLDKANAMAEAGPMVKDIFRKNPGACAGLILLCAPYRINPLQASWKCYQTKPDAPLAFEAQLITAMINTAAPISGRLKYSFTGEGPTRQVCVSAVDRDSGEVLDYLSPMKKDIGVQNSPLWKNDPDQQLCYFGARAFARRHYPEILLGVYDREEIEGAAPIRDVTPQRRGGSVEAANSILSALPDADEAIETVAVNDETPDATRDMVDDLFPDTRHANTLTDDEIRAQAEAEAAFAAERAREMAAE